MRGYPENKYPCPDEEDEEIIEDEEDEDDAESPGDTAIPEKG